MTSGHNNRCGTYLDILNAMPSYFPLDSKLTGDILTDVVKLIFHNYVWQTEQVSVTDEFREFVYLFPRST